MYVTVQMLGVSGDLRWSLGEQGLVVQMPEKRPCEHAYVLKIVKKRPFYL